jgi:hypothetical protein
LCSVKIDRIDPARYIIAVKMNARLLPRVVKAAAVTPCARNQNQILREHLSRVS